MKEKLYRKKKKPSFNPKSGKPTNINHLSIEEREANIRKRFKPNLKLIKE